MKRSIKGKITGRTVIIISVSLALILGLSFIFTMAEFTKSSRAKRVIATDEGTGMLFSSNYLSANSTLSTPTPKVYRRKIYAAAAGDPAIGTITICNYAQGNPTKVYEKTINYSIVAKLVVLSNNGTSKRDAVAGDITAGENVKLKYNNTTPAITLSASNLSHTFTGLSLPGLTATTDLLDVEFSSDFNDTNVNLALYVCAVPTVTSSNIYELDAAFTTGLSNIKNTWRGEFNENMQENGVTPGQPYYDGFNYTITGTGSGTFTLTWDESKLQINQIFLSEYSLTPVNNPQRNGWKQITLTVDSAIKDRYDLQFYYAEGVSDLTSWVNLTSAVTYNYEETQIAQP